MWMVVNVRDAFLGVEVEKVDVNYYMKNNGQKIFEFLTVKINLNF
jgi:hypothetical protein